jgi:hypothetical protein
VEPPQRALALGPDLALALVSAQVLGQDLAAVPVLEQEQGSVVALPAECLANSSNSNHNRLDYLPQHGYRKNLSGTGSVGVPVSVSGSEDQLLLKQILELL